MTRHSVSLSLMLLSILFSHPLWAASNMTFGGTLIEPPPCTINGGGTIDVDFQNRVGISKVNGVNYMKTIDYIIDCDPGVNPWEMRWTVNGIATSYDDAAVQTNIDGLGIRLLQNGQPFTLNTPVVVARGSKLILQAVPVQKPGVTLSEGAFAATATLLAEFQ